MNAQLFAEALSQKFPDYEYYVEAGVKFDKIVQRTTKYEGGQRSVHAFVERATGDLIKAAGWKAPAKIKTGWATKFNLVTEFEEAIESADKHGGYLYQN